MSDVTIYGMPQSTYVRSCRMTCLEKGIGYDLEPCAPHSEEMLALNPTGRMPAFRHGDLVLQESSAIARYLDETFPGPKLQPDDIASRTQMNLWMSLIADSFYQVMIRDLALPRFGITEASEEAIGQAATTLAAQLKRTDEILQQRRYLAGDELTLADLFLVPILFWVEMTPEGKAVMPNYPALGRWYQAIAERPSFKDTVPPMPG